MGDYIIGGDLGGSNLRTVVADEEGILLKVRDNVVKRGKDTAIPEQFCSQIMHALKKLSIKPGEISAIGLSSAGPFRKDGIVTPNLCGGLSEGRKLPNNWKSIPMPKYIRERFKGSIFRMGNDCVTAVVAETLFGAGKGEDDVLYVTWSTGIGTGAYCTFMDAETGSLRVGLLHGKNGNAPHGGHICPGNGEAYCGCGQRGDVEAMASGEAIAVQARHELANNDRKHDSMIWEYCGNKPERLETKHVFMAAKKKDNIAMRIADKAIGIFGSAIISYINLLDTRLIILGGSVMNDNDYIMPRLKKYIRENSFRALSDGVTLKPAELGRHLGDIAGLSLVMPDGWIPDWQRRKPWKKDVEEADLGKD